MKIKLIKDLSGRIIATNVEDDEADWDDEDRQEIEENHWDYSMAFDLVTTHDKALKILFDLPLGQWILLNKLYAQADIQSNDNLTDIYVCWLDDVRETEYKLVGFFHDKDLFSQIVIRLNKLKL